MLRFVGRDSLVRDLAHFKLITLQTAHRSNLEVFGNFPVQLRRLREKLAMLMRLWLAVRLSLFSGTGVALLVSLTHIVGKLKVIFLKILLELLGNMRKLVF